MRALLLLSAALLGSSCAIAPTSGGDGTSSVALADEFDDSVFALGRTILDGIEPPHDELLAVGDRVLYGVALVDEQGARTWYVRITSLEAEATIGDGLALHVELFDDSARLVANHDAHIARYLIGGIVRGCVEFATVRVPGESMALSERGKARAALVDVLRTVEASAALSRVFWRVVRKPTTTSVLGNITVSVDSSQLDLAHPETNPLGDGSAFAFPLRVLVNKKPALVCKMTVVEPRPPVRLCGGVAALVGHDPDDPRRRVVVQLLAARTNS